MRTKANDGHHLIGDAKQREESLLKRAKAITENDALELDKPLTNRAFLIGCAHISQMIRDLIDAKLNDGENINPNDPIGEENLEDLKSAFLYDKSNQEETLFQGFLERCK